jgi:hypothetical protein
MQGSIWSLVTVSVGHRDLHIRKVVGRMGLTENVTGGRDPFISDAISLTGQGQFTALECADTLCTSDIQTNRALKLRLQRRAFVP